MAGSVQAHQARGRGGHAAVVVQQQPVQPVRVRVRVSRVERVHQRYAVVRRTPQLSVRRRRGRPQLPDKVAVVQSVQVIRSAGGRAGLGRRGVRPARVDLLPQGAGL